MNKLFRQSAKFTVLFISALLLVWRPAAATLTIHITEGVEGALPIALVPFTVTGTDKLPVSLTEVVGADLVTTGRFAPLPENDLIERPDESTKVEYALWRNKRVDYVVVGKIQQTSPGNYSAQFELVDVIKGTRMIGQTFQAKASGLRRVAHLISDQIYEAVTGQRGAFDTYLAYVTITKDRRNKAIYRLAVADVDGANEQMIYESTWPIFSPAWSPDATRLAFVVLRAGNPELYIQNVYSKYAQKVAAFQGLNNAPAWSPDGRHMALTLSKDGNAEIYIMAVDTKKLIRITNSFAVETEAAFAADGSALFFTSDRGGKPQIYRVKISDHGANGPAQRLTFDGEYNARAAVSPDGKHIAMVNGGGEKSRIGVLDMETEQFTIVTDMDTKLAESPSFAPNGGMIIYETRADDKGVLVVTSADGRVKHRLSLQSGDVRQPAWSPYKRGE